MYHERNKISKVEVDESDAYCLLSMKTWFDESNDRLRYLFQIFGEKSYGMSKYLCFRAKKQKNIIANWISLPRYRIVFDDSI